MKKIFLGLIMKLASTFLQYIYGGKNLEQPEWLSIAMQKLQTMNAGYHWGRFINCIEVTLHAYNALLENQGTFFPNVTPLPTLPPLIPGYIEQLHPRMLTMDETKISYRLSGYGLNYTQFVNYLTNKQIPAYSHLILFATLKKIYGSHALSGFVVPNEAGNGIHFHLYDAQGFLPDTWLHPEQFDEFYSFEMCYVYDSKKTQNAIKIFIDECKSAALNRSEQEKTTEDETQKPDLMREKLYEFIKLELFRLEAKLIVASTQNTTALEDKINQYKEILSQLITNKFEQNTYQLTADFFVKTAKIAKNHHYSCNWFNPQSSENFYAYFKKFIPHTSFQGAYTVDAITQYIAMYLTHEIARLSMLNEYTNSYIEEKIALYTKELENLFFQAANLSLLNTRLEEIKKISAIPRHWSTMYLPTTSSTSFDTYLKPLQEHLINEMQAEELNENWVDYSPIETESPRHFD